MLIRANQSCLLIVDIQANLAPAVVEPESLIANAELLLRAARRLGIPILASEQYPRGIGHIVPELAAILPEQTVVEKLHFSCLQDAIYNHRLRDLGRRQTIVAGIEAHVCVLQTAEDLLSAGYTVFVVADAISSRKAANQRAAIHRLAAAGARIVTTEMVVFEWLGKAGTAEFKEIIPLIKGGG